MKSFRRTTWVLILVCLGITACAPKVQIQSQPALVEDDLYFGLSTSQGPVTPAQWNGFLNNEVTPRFPDGLTVLDAKGQWKNAQGSIGKEPTKLLILVHPDNADEDKAVQTLIDAYKKEFHQESVMKVRSRPEVSF